MTAEWMDRAACIGEDPEDFFPPEGETTNVANEVCARCPVVEQCLQMAIANHDVGIWGGTTKNQRRRLSPGRGLAECPECGQKFANKGAVAAHIGHKHTDRHQIGKKPTRCDDCGQVFKSSQGMANHRTYKHKPVAA